MLRRNREETQRQEREKEAWSVRRGVSPSRGRVCAQRLLGHIGKWGYESDNVRGCCPPGTDHQSIWIYDRKPAIFVAQPYWHLPDDKRFEQFSQDRLDRLADWARYLRLPYRVSHEQWWNSGTILIEVFSNRYAELMGETLEGIRR